MRLMRHFSLSARSSKCPFPAPRLNLAFPDMNERPKVGGSSSLSSGIGSGKERCLRSKEALLRLRFHSLRGGLRRHCLSRSSTEKRENDDTQSLSQKRYFEHTLLSEYLLFWAQNRGNYLESLSKTHHRVLVMVMKRKKHEWG